MTKTPLPSVAEFPVRVGIRLIALSRLDDGLAAREQLVNGREGEALHDFRVALRRLRSGLRAYRPWFEDTVGKQDRHRLRDISRPTGRSRDIEVQLQWLEQATLPREAAEGARLLEARLRSALPACDRATLRAAHRFPAAAARLRECLRRYCDAVDPDAPYGTETTATVTADLMADLVAGLASDLDLIRTSDDPAACHRARIEVKRLRYLLEPFRTDVANGEATLAVLRELQDELGALHDIDVLLLELDPARSGVDQGDERAAIDRLACHVRTVRQSKLQWIQDGWLEQTAASLATETAAFAAALAAHGGGAGCEIERKYLLNGLPRRRKNRTVVRIDQGWLPGEVVQERIRRVRGENGTKWLRTIKLGGGLVRREIEEEMDEELFRRLWPLTRGRRISKRRYAFRDHGRTWTVDRFIGFDLVLAEIELDSPNDDVEPPDWLRPYIEAEVTGRADYLNVNLAVRTAQPESQA